ncbi:MAG: hypothetical protein HYV09_35460 [Deltaproteobacteria bacterium]|nr:hypothetical protein [Deltaproteobacteria bacterium]
MRALVALLFVAATSCSLSNEDSVETMGVRAPYRTAIDDHPCPAEKEGATAARRAIARVRAMAGLPALRCDAAASAAALGHCRYITANGELTHVQTPGRPQFTGVTFADRLAAASFGDQPATEVLANISGALVIDGARGFINSVYHRAPFLRTEATSFGYGEDAACSTIDFGRPPEAKRSPERTVLWPPDGSVNVPTTFWSGNELPNPVPGTTTVGSPISLIREAPLTGVTAEIVGPKGPLPAVLLTHKDDPNKLVRLGEAHLVPRAPLAPATQYTARFAFRAGGTSITTTTTFTTGDD